ncbi:MAG: hypothetical protein AAGD38_14295 [Acidobacteriota bacterium]
MKTVNAPAFVFVALLAAATPGWAQSGAIFEITRSTIDAGGSTERSVGPITVRGTIGQPDVGSSGNGAFSVNGGFWASEGRSGIIFMDGFESGDFSAWDDVVGAVDPPPPITPPSPNVVVESSSSADGEIRLTLSEASEPCQEGESCRDQSE